MPEVFSVEVTKETVDTFFIEAEDSNEAEKFVLSGRYEDRLKASTTRMRAVITSSDPTKPKSTTKLLFGDWE